MMTWIRISLVVLATAVTTAAIAQPSKCAPGCVNTPTQKCTCQ